MRVTSARAYTEERDALAHDWQLFMSDVLPWAIWLPLPNIGQEIIRYVRDWNLNGFIITGGNNLFECPIRDVSELAIIEYALRNNMPIFGICRGFQIIAHYFGYKLEKCENHAGTRHKVKLDGFRLRSTNVNSYHDNCGPLSIRSPLVAFAFDDEGRIEGFYHQYKCLKAVMWHPERERPISEFDRKMLRDFFHFGDRK